jgi:hypothetical protein
MFVKPINVMDNTDQMSAEALTTAENYQTERTRVITLVV